MSLLSELIFLLFFTYATSDIHVHKETLAKRKLRYGGKNIFLTHIGLKLTIIINILTILKFEIHPCILIFCTALELTITILFYTLLFLNEQNLNVPDKNLKYIRNRHIKEVSLHFLPFVYLVNTKSQVININLIFVLGNVFTLVYCVALYVFKQLNKEFCYPVLNRLSSRGRFCLLIVGNLILNTCIFIVSKINKIR